MSQVLGRVRRRRCETAWVYRIRFHTLPRLVTCIRVGLLTVRGQLKAGRGLDDMSGMLCHTSKACAYVHWVRGRCGGMLLMR